MKDAKKDAVTVKTRFVVSDTVNVYGGVVFALIPESGLA